MSKDREDCLFNAKSKSNRIVHVWCDHHNCLETFILKLSDDDEVCVGDRFEVHDPPDCYQPK